MGLSTHMALFRRTPTAPLSPKKRLSRNNPTVFHAVLDKKRLASPDKKRHAPKHEHYESRLMRARSANLRASVPSVSTGELHEIDEEGSVDQETSSESDGVTRVTELRMRLRILMERDQVQWGAKEMKLALKSGGVDVPDSFTDKAELRTMIFILAEAAHAKWAREAEADLAAAKAAVGRPTWKHTLRARSLAVLGSRSSATTSYAMGTRGIEGDTDRGDDDDSDEEDSTELRESIHKLGEEGESDSSQRSAGGGQRPSSYRKGFRAKGASHTAAAAREQLQPAKPQQQRDVAAAAAVEDTQCSSPMSTDMMNRKVARQAGTGVVDTPQSAAADAEPDMFTKARHGFDELVGQWFGARSHVSPDQIRQIA